MSKVSGSTPLKSEYSCLNVVIYVCMYVLYATASKLLYIQGIICTLGKECSKQQWLCMISGIDKGNTSIYCCKPVLIRDYWHGHYCHLMDNNDKGCWQFKGNTSVYCCIPWWEEAVDTVIISILLTTRRAVWQGKHTHLLLQTLLLLHVEGPRSNCWSLCCLDTWLLIQSLSASSWQNKSCWQVKYTHLLFGYLPWVKAIGMVIIGTVSCQQQQQQLLTREIHPFTAGYLPSVKAIGMVIIGTVSCPQ